MLPPRDITPPKNVFKSVMGIYVPVVVLVMALLLALNHHSAGAMGGIIAIGAVFLILGIEVPLIIRGQDRRQKALMSELPDGGFYAGRVALLPYDGNRGLPVGGTVVFTVTGLTFAPRKSGAVPLEFSWSDLCRMRLAPMPGKIGVGRLTLTLTDGRTRSFTVPRYGTMARILSQQP